MGNHQGAPHGADPSGAVQWVGDLIHAVMPHQKGAIYFWTIAFCLLALVYVYVSCRRKGAHACLADGWQLSTIVHAAPMPVYILMPFAPLDRDLVAAIAEDQIVIAIAGIYALYVSVREVHKATREACEVKSKAN